MDGAQTADWNPAEWEALAQRSGESDRAHTAFLDYVRLGPGRSLDTLLARYRDQTGYGPGIKTPTRRRSTLGEWSIKWEWQARLTAYKTEQDAREQLRWEERRREVQEADWTAGVELRALAQQMLAQTPQFLKTSRKLVRGQKGKPDREVITLALDAGVLLKALEVASKLQRLATGMPDSHTEVSTSGQMITTSDLAAIRDEMEQWERERYG